MTTSKSIFMMPKDISLITCSGKKKIKSSLLGIIREETLNWTQKVIVKKMKKVRHLYLSFQRLNKLLKIMSHMDKQRMSIMLSSKIMLYFYKESCFILKMS